MTGDPTALAANPVRLVAFEAARSALFWLPVFFLYFERALPVSQVLALEAVYYFAGTLLEVPSGMASDRLGRRPTLVCAAAMQALGALILFTGTGFLAFAAGQVLLAGSWSFVSGTDTALLYESLAAQGRTHETLRWEAALQRAGLVSLALAAVLGGLLARLSLGAGYAATAASSLVAVVLALRLVEPPRSLAPAREAPGRTTDLRGFAAQLADPWLRFGLAVAVAAMVFNHVPFEFLQPILRDALGRADLAADPGAPLASGLVLGATMALGAWVSARVPALAARLGAARTLLLAQGIQALAIGVLALSLHPLAVCVLLVRSVPQALTQPVLRSELHPRLDGAWRATWFSAQSFVAHCAFGVVLLAASRATSGLERLEGAELQTLLGRFALAALATILVLAALAPREPRR